MGGRARRTTALLAAGLALSCLNAAPRPPDRTELRVRPGFGSEADGRAEGWRRYAAARIAGPLRGSDRRGSPDPPGLEEEAFARELMALAWAELAVGAGWRDRYLEELGWVASEGWIREYSWSCLHVLRGLPPEDLELEEFRDWFEANLRGHRVETWVTARSDGERVLFEVGREAHAPYVCEPARALQSSESAQR